MTVIFGHKTGRNNLFFEIPFFTTTARNNKLPRWFLKPNKTNKVWKAGRTNRYKSLENIPLPFIETRILPRKHAC